MKSRRKRKRPFRELLIKRFSEFGGIEAPKRAGDAGYDLVVAEEKVLPPKTAYPFDIHCDFAMKIPDTYFGLITNRSSAPRRGIGIVPAIIDSGYTGPIFVCVYNTTDASIVVTKGSRLAQLVLIQRFTPPLCFVDKLPKTERGGAGLGSTGATGV